MQKKKISLVKNLGGEAQGVEIDGNEYRFDDEELQAVRVPESVISQIDLEDVPEELTFRMETNVNDLLSAYAVSIMDCDADGGFVEITSKLRRGIPSTPIGPEILARGTFQELFLATCGDLVHISYTNTKEEYEVTATYWVLGKKFADLIGPVRALVPQIKNRLDRLHSSIMDAIVGAQGSTVSDGH